MPDEPPLVTRVDDGPKLVIRADDRPRPDLWAASGSTLLFWLTTLGTAVLAVVVIGGFRVSAGGWDVLKSPGNQPGAVEALPPAVTTGLAWAFPVGYTAGLVLTLVFVRRVIGPGWVREFGLNRLPLPFLGLAVVAVPGYSVLGDGIAVALRRLVDEPFFQATGLSPPDPGVLGRVYAGYPWWFVVLAVGVGPGVVEELWCRGYLGRGLLGRYGRAGGVFITSLLFGLLHPWPPSYVLTAGALGAVLHFTYLASRSLWVPILLHVLNNSTAGLVAVGALHDGAGQAAPMPTAAFTAFALGGSGLAMWAAQRPGRRRLAVVAALIGVTSSCLLVRELWP